MRGIASLAALVLAASSAVLAFEVPTVFENVELSHNIDLTGSYVRKSIELTIQNIAETAESDYFFTIDLAEHKHVAIVEAQDLSASAVVPVEPLGPDNTETVFVYRIPLPKPLEPGQQTQLKLIQAITAGLSPLPETGSQEDQQFIAYKALRHVVSPYLTRSETVRVKAARPVEDLLGLDGEASADGTLVTFGPYTDVAPSSVEPLEVRYENPKSMPKVTKLVRDIWVSHWGGSVSFENTYWLTNIGTRLRDTFSRIDYTRGQTTFNLNVAAIKELAIPLPGNARDAYYTDLVGNVSTSHFRTNPAESVFEIRPRFPIFGGWNYNFTLGWSHNLDQFVKHLGNDAYLLKVPLLEGPVDTSYDEIHVKIILPEGASDIQVTSLFGSALDITTTHSYLDSTGRPTVQMYYSNLIDAHRIGDIFVSYKYTTADALRKPLAVSLTFGCIFTFFLLLSKLDINITKKSKSTA